MKKLFTLFQILVIFLVAFTSNAQTNCNPAIITNVIHEGSGNRITWTMPTGGEEVTISQQSGYFYDACGAPENFGVYQRFIQEDLAAINGGKLTQIVFIPTYDVAFQTEPGHTYAIQIYQGGAWGTEDKRNPGTLISSQELNNNDLTFNQDNTITLETLVTIDASQELWIGYFCTNIDSIQGAPKFPVGADEGPRKEELGNILFNNNQWNTLYELSSFFNINFCIKGIVQTTDGTTVNLYFNGDKIKSNIEGSSFYHENPTGEEYCYKVEVNCKEGGVSSFSNEVCIIEAECHPATSLDVKYAADCSSTDLTWVAPENMSGTILYNIYRNDTLLISNHGATSYQTTNFNPNIVNIWSVKVVCPEGESDAMSVTKEDCVVGVKNNGQTTRVTIYPNPATKELYVQSSKFKVQSIEIFDIFGRKLYEHNNSYGLTVLRSYGLTTDGVVINVSHLSAGVYFVRLVDERGISVQKFVKE